MNLKADATRRGVAALLIAGALALASCGVGGAATEEGGHGDVGGADHGSAEHGDGGGSDEATRGAGEHAEHGASAASAPAEAGVEVAWTATPRTPGPGEPVELSYRITDAESGEAVTELPVDHERQMHLIAVSKDLEHFQHIHPKPATDGGFTVAAEFPETGTYVLYDEFKRGDGKVLDRRELRVGGEEGPAASLNPDGSPKTIEGITVSLDAPEQIRAGEEADFTFTLEKDGRLVDDLTEYLGAAAHVAIVSEDTESFAHTHGEDANSGAHEESGESGHGGHGGMENTQFGPEISFSHTFSEPGLYKVWGEFNHEGNVVAVPFVIEIV